MQGETLPPLPAHRAPLRLYYITDRQQLAGDAAAQRAGLLARIAAAVAAGVDFIQLREKDLSVRELEPSYSSTRASTSPLPAAPMACTCPPTA
jgi:thiamine monophosphate synthase